jgi:hypothetical protein
VVAWKVVWKVAAWVVVVRISWVVVAWVVVAWVVVAWVVVAWVVVAWVVVAWVVWLFLFCICFENKFDFRIDVLEVGRLLLIVSLYLNHFGSLLFPLILGTMILSYQSSSYYHLLAINSMLILNPSYKYDGYIKF